MVMKSFNGGVKFVCARSGEVKNVKQLGASVFAIILTYILLVSTFIISATNPRRNKIGRLLTCRNFLKRLVAGRIELQTLGL